MKIKAIAKVNSEIIARVTEIRVSMWEAYQAAKNGKMHATPAQLVHNLRVTTALRLLAPTDIFNDKIRYECASFADLCRLNVEMLTVAKKFAFFGETARAVAELQKFRTNLELVQTALGQIESTLITPIAA